MRAIMVSVDYADLLAITLPYNRQHFSEVMVVTSPADSLSAMVATQNRCQVYTTDLFYLDGAIFNKWRALESALDEFGRQGWLCLMDADILWPSSLTVEEHSDNIQFHSHWGASAVVKGQLCSPLRRMMVNLPMPFLSSSVPPEHAWTNFPVHRNINEWAGYSQIFHCEDENLPTPPWHDINWKHAGGADSFFQALWPRASRIRPCWECLHLGEPGTNWMGRATQYTDGKIPPDAASKRSRILQMWRERNSKRGRPDQFSHERIDGGGR